MIVVDANVILAAFRSSRGASHQLLRLMLEGRIEFAVSPAVALEYEDVLKRPGLLGKHPWINAEDIDVILDAVFSRAYVTSPWFRFRPFLSDPKDDLYVECALAAGASVIVSRDKHFDHPGLRAFGLVAMNARDYLVRHHDRSNPE